jgi:hypothetical protein
MRAVDSFSLGDAGSNLLGGWGGEAGDTTAKPTETGPQLVAPETLASSSAAVSPNSYE